MVPQKSSRALTDEFSGLSLKYGIAPYPCSENNQVLSRVKENVCGDIHENKGR